MEEQNAARVGASSHAIRRQPAGVDRQERETETMLARTADRGRVERGVIIDLVAGAWNCPQHITPWWTTEEIATAVEPLHARIAELETQLASLKGSPT